MHSQVLKIQQKIYNLVKTYLDDEDSFYLVFLTIC
jgi:hypothetical protein